MRKKNIIKSIDIILKDIKKNAISKEHRHAELNLDCPECKFRLLEGCLEWYKDLLKPLIYENIRFNKTKKKI